MTLEGKDAEDFVAKLRAENEKKRAEKLAAAKEEAARRGKEPFDLEKLEKLADTSRQGRMDPVETRHVRFEEMYYVQFPDLMTIAELAEQVNELNRWS